MELSSYEKKANTCCDKTFANMWTSRVKSQISRDFTCRVCGKKKKIIQSLTKECNSCEIVYVTCEIVKEKKIKILLVHSCFHVSCYKLLTHLNTGECM